MMMTTPTICSTNLINIIAAYELIALHYLSCPTWLHSALLHAKAQGEPSKEHARAHGAGACWTCL